MDVCGIDLLMKDDGFFCVCEVNVNVGFIVFDKVCNLDVVGIIVDYVVFFLFFGWFIWCMFLFFVVFIVSEISELELGFLVSIVVDNMSVSFSFVDSDFESMEWELFIKFLGGLFNMN